MMTAHPSRCLLWKQNKRTPHLNTRVYPLHLATANMHSWPGIGLMISISIICQDTMIIHKPGQQVVRKRQRVSPFFQTCCTTIEVMMMKKFHARRHKACRRLSSYKYNFSPQCDSFRAIAHPESSDLLVMCVLYPPHYMCVVSGREK